MKFGNILAAATLVSGLTASALVSADAHTGVMITPTLESVQVVHDGKPFTIQRNPDKEHSIPAPYDKTSRGCPPFCIQPMHVIPGVETIGELEILGYLKRIADGDKSVLVIDSRTPEWIARGTIPGSVNVPWNKISVDVGDFEIGASAENLEHILADEFGASSTANGWDFANAKTLVLFCNGAWCPQSSINIKTLAKMGYPVQKLKWYRGGMQDWVSLGFNTVDH